MTSYTQLTNPGPHLLREAFHDEPTAAFMTTVSAVRPLGSEAGVVSILWSADAGVVERRMSSAAARALAAELVASCDVIEATP